MKGATRSINQGSPAKAHRRQRGATSLLTGKGSGFTSSAQVLWLSFAAVGCLLQPRQQHGADTEQGSEDMSMSSKKKVIAVAVTTVALTAGTFGAATAASKTTKVTRTSFTTVATQAQAGKLGRGQELTDILTALVAKGTITQAQADAIIAAHTAADAARDAARSGEGQAAYEPDPPFIPRAGGHGRAGRALRSRA